MLLKTWNMKGLLSNDVFYRVLRKRLPKFEFVELRVSFLVVIFTFFQFIQIYNNEELIQHSILAGKHRHYSCLSFSTKEFTLCKPFLRMNKGYLVALPVGSLAKFQPVTV